MPLRSSAALTASGLLAVAALTGCSGSDGLGGDFSVEDALTALPPPPDDDFVVVRAADLAEATELADSDPDDDDWIQQLSDGTVYVPFPYSFVRGSETGVEPRDADSFAALQSGGSGVLEVYRLADGDAPSDTDDAGGLVRASEGDDTVVLASDDDLLESWRDRDDTLADDEHFGAMAEALDDGDVYAAELFTTGSGRGPVRAIGIGQAVEDDKPVEYAVFALEEDADAEQRAEDIEGALEDTSAVEDGRLEVDEVDTDGQVVVVRLLTEEAGATTELLIARGELRLPE